MNRSSNNFRILNSIRIQSSKWNFSDLRIDIPPLSFGSDASNPHTQYSNAIATVYDTEAIGIGACFTLGEGNEYVCAAAEYVIKRLDGVSVAELICSQSGLIEILANPLQLRWLSPNAGLPQMAAGLILNTILDLASKKAGMPAWKFLAYLETDELAQLVSKRHLRDFGKVIQALESGPLDSHEFSSRIDELDQVGIPAYFTTWIGSDSTSLISEINTVNSNTGISKFKIKIGTDKGIEQEKITHLMDALPPEFLYAADANQKLTYDSARDWMEFLSHSGFLWLEEPFAPDNLLLFQDLVREKTSMRWTCQIATGENCPNLHTAQALMVAGIDRFQADPCRMVGVTDAIFSGVLSKLYKIDFTPHAGGAGLDELSPHLQFFHLARIDRDKEIATSLTETIGFSSKFYAQPSIIQDGRIVAPREPGLLVGLEKSVSDKLLPFRDGVTWLKL